MSDRCEPPEHLRGVDGWHWVQVRSNTPKVIRWHASSWITVSDLPLGPARAYGAGWRYIAPVTPPAEVDALRAEVADTDRLLLATQEDLGNAQAEAQHWATRVAQIHAECKELRAENARLRKLLMQARYSHGQDRIEADHPGWCDAATYALDTVP